VSINFYPDHPIERVADDRLGRKEFARALARAVVARKGAESLVIGLFGECGGGKGAPR